MKKIIIALIIVLFSGCMASVDRKDFKDERLYAYVNCIYLNQKGENKDNSSCSPIAKAYDRKSAIDDKIYILKVCSDENILKLGITQRECQLYLK